MSDAVGCCHYSGQVIILLMFQRNLSRILIFLLLLKLSCLIWYGVQCPACGYVPKDKFLIELSSHLLILYILLSRSGEQVYIALTAARLDLYF